MGLSGSCHCKVGGRGGNIWFLPLAEASTHEHQTLTTSCHLLRLDACSYEGRVDGRGSMPAIPCRRMPGSVANGYAERSSAHLAGAPPSRDRRGIACPLPNSTRPTMRPSNAADGDALVVALRGTVARAAATTTRRTRRSLRIAPIRPVALIGCERLGLWDSILAIFLVQCQDFCEEHKLQFDTTPRPSMFPGSSLSRTPSLSACRRRRRCGRRSSRGLFRRDHARNELLAAITFAGEVMIALAGFADRRVHMRWREFWVACRPTLGCPPHRHADRGLVGVIIAFWGWSSSSDSARLLRVVPGRFGMLREMGALMTGIITRGARAPHSRRNSAA